MIIGSKIYCFSLFDSGYTSVHSLIRDLFDSPKNVCPSLSQGDLLYVLSKSYPAKNLHHSCQNAISINEGEKTVELKTHVAFCNRHKESIIPEKIYSQRAIEKFCDLSGLEVKKTECTFLGPHHESKFNIHNAFKIKGQFIIKDHSKFNHALTNGVGSRKSYGYGLILIKQGGKNESAD